MFLLAGVLWGFAFACPLKGQVKDPAVVKTAFLCNFVKFTDWPAEAFQKPDSPLVIGVLGTDPLGSRLDNATREMTVHGRRIVVRRFASVPAPGECHVLFAGEGGIKRLGEIVSALGQAPVLVVGDEKGFAEQGGTIGLVESQGSLRFEVNLGAANTGGLKLGSGLLKLADKVYKTTPRGKT